MRRGLLFLLLGLLTMGVMSAVMLKALDSNQKVVDLATRPAESMAAADPVATDAPAPDAAGTGTESGTGTGVGEAVTVESSVAPTPKPVTTSDFDRSFDVAVYVLFGAFLVICGTFGALIVAGKDRPWWIGLLLGVFLNVVGIVIAALIPHVPEVDLTDPVVIPGDGRQTHHVGPPRHAAAVLPAGSALPTIPLGGERVAAPPASTAPKAE